MNKTPTTLIIMDGFGIAPPADDNAVTLAKTPVLDKLFQEYAHTTNLVPFILCGAGTELRPGRLADIAPTILDVMGLACPEEMDGKTLIVK